MLLKNQIEIPPHFEVEYTLAGKGAPLVFLHAFPLSAEMWAGQIEAFQDEYLCLAPNARGFGSTSPFSEAPVDGPPSIAQMAHDLNALLDALDIQEKILLCGLSMGGYAAQVFAREYPHRLRGLVLCDTRAEADTDETKVKREENIKAVHHLGSWNLAEKLSATLLGETTRKGNPELVKQVIDWGGEQQVSTLSDALEALRDREDMTPYLPQISVPTLLIFGEEDALAPREVIETLHSGIPNAQLKIIERAGHLPNLEQPDEFNRVLVEFLQALD